ncbi:MAG TPA: sulfite exporter TauE/SafE family protein [Gammaproteobacteria bacterium]|nr:sulfite exporter TauE/SafE family protein [Gammaproteobacteria bacterium]
MPLPEALGLFALIGTVAGLLAGLFGIGGGLVIVPVLAFTFRRQGVDESILMHLALGTSMASIVVTAASSVRAHRHHSGILWHRVLQLAPAIVSGAVLGAAIANDLPGPMLARFVGVFELAIAAQMWLGSGRHPSSRRPLPRLPFMLGAGAGIGTVSSLAGIGGGALTVPFLTWFDVPMNRAAGVAAACALPTALAGSISYLVNGWGHAALPLHAAGFVYWPAVVGIGCTTVFIAPLGARLAQRLPEKVMKRLFAVLLLAMGVHLLL